MTDEERKKKKELEDVKKAAEKGFNTIYTDSGQQVPNAESPKTDDDHKQELGGEGG